MNEDLVVVVNEKDEVVGTATREETHRKGIPHRIVVVYVENKLGQILVQVRMTGRLDHSSAGHVDPGETYEEAAYRELKEELGVHDVKLTYVGQGVSEEILQKEGQHRVHVFQIFKCQAEPGNLQPDEVKEVYWAEPNEILRGHDGQSQRSEILGRFSCLAPYFSHTAILSTGKSKMWAVSAHVLFPILIPTLSPSRARLHTCSLPSRGGHCHWVLWCERSTARGSFLRG